MLYVSNSHLSASGLLKSNEKQFIDVCAKFDLATLVCTEVISAGAQVQIETAQDDNATEELYSYLHKYSDVNTLRLL